MKAVIVHGFNDPSAGANNVDKLIPCLKKHGITIDKDEGDYGYVGLLSVRLFNRKKRKDVISRLAKAFESADLIITFSNGANYTMQALRLLPAKYRRSKLVVHISPALNRNAPMPYAVKRELILCTPNDWAVRISSYIPFGHPWGRMGAFGRKNKHPLSQEICNHDVKRHSGWYRQQHLLETCSAIIGFKEAWT